MVARIVHFSGLVCRRCGRTFSMLGSWERLAGGGSQEPQHCNDCEGIMRPDPTAIPDGPARGEPPRVWLSCVLATIKIAFRMGFAAGRLSAWRTWLRDPKPDPDWKPGPSPLMVRSPLPPPNPNVRNEWRRE